MTTDATGETRPGSSDVVQLVDIRTEPLSVDEVLAATSDPAAGGHCVFVGTVRDSDSGRAVDELGYTSHPSAADELRTVAETVAGRHHVTAIAAVHRVGDLSIGDPAVVVAASSMHRDAAFEACRDLIDTVKTSVPLWKHQRFSDGTATWVGSP